ALDRGDWLDGVGAADGLRARLRKTKVLHFTLLNQIFHRTSNVFDWHLQVDAMLIEEIDGLDLESFQRSLGNLSNVLGATVDCPRSPELEAEFSSDHDLLSERCEGFANQLFVVEGTVGFSGVEEGNALLDGLPDESDHLPLIRRWPVTKAHAHAAESNGRDFQIAFSEFALLHCRFLRRGINVSAAAA